MRWGKHKHFTIPRAKASFLSKIKKDHRTGCWNWTGTQRIDGRYGILGLMGKPWLAHRAAWFLLNGKHPGSLCVCHSCDNGLCVNPSHLFLGTQGDNVHDMENKRRANHPSGENHGRSKLSWKDVNRIRRLRDNGLATRAIARMYPQVSGFTISCVVKNRTWLPDRIRRPKLTFKIKVPN